MRYRVGILAAVLAVAACGPDPIKQFPSSPYFTDLHECVDRSGNTHVLENPIVDGFYTYEMWFAGQIPMIDDIGAVEVLGNFPDNLHFVIPNVPLQILWKARAGDNWQPASRVLQTKPTNVCIFV